MPTTPDSKPLRAAKTRSLSLAELKSEAQSRPGLFAGITAMLRRRRMPQIKTGEEQINALGGNNLTWFVGSDGKGIGLPGPPMHAAHVLKHERRERFTGRSLTRHINPKGKAQTEFHVVRKV